MTKTTGHIKNGQTKGKTDKASDQSVAKKSQSQVEAAKNGKKTKKGE